VKTHFKASAAWIEDLIGHHLKGEIIDKKQGTYGIVYIVKKESFPQYIAYKTIQADILQQVDEIKLENFVREIKQWFRVKSHPLILRPFYITFVKGLPFVCMPFCETDLQTYLEKRGKLSVVEALIITAQILKALMFCKNNGIEAHQDLKPTNVLLEDLSNKFEDFPSEDMPFFRYRVRVSDFGNANAWKELGKPHGSRPYMAPEQFLGKGDFLKVDVFATGVMLYELVTGKHPIGEKTSDLWPEPKEGFPKKFKHEKPWKEWAIKENKSIRIGEDEVSKELEKLIHNMLCANPNKRLSLDEAFQLVINILTRINKAAAEYLKILFEYYDAFTNYRQDICKLSDLIELSKIPSLRESILTDLLKEIEDMEEKISTPAEAVYFIELCFRAAKLLLKRNKTKDIEKAEELAKKIFLKVAKWKNQIRVTHVYPPLKFREVAVIETPQYRDFEVHAELANYGIIILDHILGSEETEKFVKNTGEKYLITLYLFNKAIDYKDSDVKKAIKLLDKCIELLPTEPTFYFMKALWTKNYLWLKEALEELTDTEKLQLINLIRENAEKAIKLAPDWEEPKRILGKNSEK